MRFEPTAKGLVIRKGGAQLKEALATLAEGSELLHPQIEQIVGIKRMEDERAYRGAIKWARNEYARDTGIWIETIHGRGLRHPTGNQQVKTGLRITRLKVRGMARESRRIGDVADDRLDGIGKQRRDHIVGRLQYLGLLATAEHRALIAHVGMPEVKPQRQLPSREG